MNLIYPPQGQVESLSMYGITSTWKNKYIILIGMLVWASIAIENLRSVVTCLYINILCMCILCDLLLFCHMVSRSASSCCSWYCIPPAKPEIETRTHQLSHLATKVRVCSDDNAGQYRSVLSRCRSLVGICWTAGALFCRQRSGEWK